MRTIYQHLDVFFIEELINQFLIFHLFIFVLGYIYVPNQTTCWFKRS